MKTLLALRGDKNKGKTSAIAKLFELMKKNGYKIIQDKKKKNSHDFYVIVEKKGKKIGISSYGDIVKLILTRIEIFIEFDCEIIVCACRIGGSTEMAVRGVGGYSIEFFDKLVSNNSNDHSDLNARDAQRLLTRIEALL